MLRDLAELTAEAFGAEAPRLAGLRPPEAIAAFATFTRREVERLAAGGSLPAAEAIRARLYERAREVGRAVRRSLAVTSRSDALRALRVLYRGIDIDLDVDDRTGEISVRACAFSRVYTPAVCAFISALDAGVVDGLTGGEVPVFSERITEGASRCRARLDSRSESGHVGTAP